jgi:hypothetical protein
MQIDRPVVGPWNVHHLEIVFTTIFFPILTE